MYSSQFSVGCGVHQGGILSPLLFDIYIDDLIDILSKSGYGYVSNLFFGCILYADDIILLSPSVYGLQNMLDICVTFSAHSSILFNDKKSKCVAVGTDRKTMHILPTMMLGNLSLQWTNNFKYLGVRAQLILIVLLSQCRTVVRTLL